jgi:hypothetical protein
MRISLLLQILLAIGLVTILTGGYAYTLLTVAAEAAWTPNPATLSFPGTSGFGYTTVSLTCNPTVDSAILNASASDPNMLMATYPYDTFVCNANPTRVYVGACLVGVQTWCTIANLEKYMTGTLQQPLQQQQQSMLSSTDNTKMTVVPLSTTSPALTKTVPGKVHCKDKHDKYQKKCGEDEDVNIIFQSNIATAPLAQNVSNPVNMVPNIFYDLIATIGAASIAAGTILLFVARKKKMFP